MLSKCQEQECMYYTSAESLRADHKCIKVATYLTLYSVHTSGYFILEQVCMYCRITGVRKFNISSALFLLYPPAIVV